MNNNNRKVKKEFTASEELFINQICDDMMKMHKSILIKYAQNDIRKYNNDSENDNNEYNLLYIFLAQCKFIDQLTDMTDQTTKMIDKVIKEDKQFQGTFK